jgi:hypothetical protein
MGKRIERTLGNWRWWVGFPVMVAMFPLVLFDLSLAALVTTGEVAADLRQWIARQIAPIFRWIRHGWRA